MCWPRPFGHPSLARSWVFTHSKFDSIVCLLVCLLVCVPLCCCCCGGFAADLATRIRKRKRHMQAQTAANANISRKRSGIHRKKPFWFIRYSLIWLRKAKFKIKKRFLIRKGLKNTKMHRKAYFLN